MIRVRTAQFEELARLSGIMVCSFRSAFSGLVSEETLRTCADPENCRKLLEHLYPDKTMHFLAGGDAGMLVWRDTPDGAEIMAIHSLPESWGSGLGHAMLTTALEQIGSRPVFLWAFRENHRARRFYEKHGFRRDGAERISEFDGAVEICYRKP